MTKDSIRAHITAMTSEIKNLEASYAALNAAVEEHMNAEYDVYSIKNVVESKKNTMIAGGTITGKNAEERAANTWIAIPEYDDLVIAEQNALNTRAKLEIAKNNTMMCRRKIDFLSQAINTLVALDGVALDTVVLSKECLSSGSES